MKVTRIRRPLSGERVVAMSPNLAPSVGAEWRRRLNLYTGRSLSDTALTTEQEGRAGRLAVAGQAVSSGVVADLTPALEQEAGPGGETRHVLRIAPGMGLAALARLLCPDDMAGYHGHIIPWAPGVRFR